MAILGAHMSISGGFAKAVERAAAASCECVQVFTCAPQQWPVRPRAGQDGRPATWVSQPIAPSEAQAFRDKLTELKIRHPVSHGSYLLNIASPDATIHARSVAALIVELQRAEQLGIPDVILHPGAHLGAGEDQGIATAIQSLNAVLTATESLACGLLLETTAGQGTCLGHRFEHLAAMASQVATPERMGICFDTCHVFAAGYRLQERREYLATMREFDQLIGLDKIRAFHLNDSKRELGSRVDRHEHIGRGELGIEPFRHLLTDRRLHQVPMYLETPKGTEQGEDLDVINLRTLRALIKPRTTRRE